MMGLDQINAEIANIKAHGTSYEDCQRLANLYICRNAMLEDQPTTGTIPDTGTEFSKAFRAADSKAAWAVLDDLMDTLYAINKPLYNSVLRNLRQ